MNDISLYQGDCLEIMDILIDKNIIVDAVITDPPYGTTNCRWDSVIPFDSMWEKLGKITKPETPIILFGTEPFSSVLRLSNIKNYKYDWVWDKVTARGHLVAKKKPMQQTENISVFQSKSAHNYYPQMIDRPKNKIQIRSERREFSRTEIIGGKKSVLKDKVYDQWYPKNIIQVSNANSSNKSLHPTQKPTELIEYLIKTYTLEDETVLDFTMGSGTTGVACMNTGRKFIGIEIDHEYFKIAEKRIEESKFEKEYKEKTDLSRFF
jgi:DNA modification methylase